MAKHDLEYFKLVKDVLFNGEDKTDRTGTGTRAVFAREMRFDLSDGTIPMLTSKKVHTKSNIRELLWYLEGGTNNNDLRKHGVTIWDEWAKEDGDLGPVYGYQWRKWNKWSDVDGNPPGTYQIEQIDQIATLINTLKTNPDSRRLLVSAWNVADLDDMALPPCHYAFQCFVSKKDGVQRLSLMLNQRSADVGLGVPFNITQYSLLLHMIAHVVGMQPGEFIWRGGDVHIYSNHVSQLLEQIEREPFDSPTLRFARPVDSIDDFGYNDFIIEGYQSHPAIKMDVAV